MDVTSLDVKNSGDQGPRSQGGGEYGSDRS